MGRQQRFLLLDGLRGVAALAVVAFHFGTRAHLPYLFPRGYLAVDFFFVLSGFVIAHAYGDRLRSTLSPGAFIRARAIRLLPMLLPGTLAGAVIEFWRPEVGDSARHILQVAVAAILGSLAIPLPVPTTMQADIFPINGPVWSLFFEIIANGVFLAIARSLRWRLLAAVLMIGGGICISILALRSGAVDFGASLPDWPGGLPRVLFSFFAGALLTLMPTRPNSLPVWIYPVVLICVMMVPPDGSTLSGLFDLGAVLLIFPTIVAFGRGTSTGSWMSPACRISGEVSYPVYALHYPFVRGICFVIGRHAFSALTRTWMAGATIVVICCLSWLMMMVYDKPIRRWLTDRTAATVPPIGAGDADSVDWKVLTSPKSG